MPFLDRAYEMQWLEDGWSSERAELRILYGRRRVGKSALLDAFVRGKRHVVYQGVEGALADQLHDLTQALLQSEDDPVLRAAPLPNWDAAFAYFGALAQRERLVIVLDEFQYLAETDPTLGSRLQRWWSREAVNLPIYLILCGSYIRFFVENVLTGPAYGRNTGSLQLTPLSYRDAALFFPDWSEEDRLRAYAVVGGMPQYLLQFDPRRSLAWNIEHKVLSRGAVLYQEADLLMREELREPRLYNSILRALSAGVTRVGDIATRVRGGAGGADLTPYLRTLQELGLAEYRQPVVGGSVRRGIWTVADPYLRFWFRFVLPNRTRLERGGAAAVYREIVAPELDHFVSKPVFEDICRAWVVDTLDQSSWSRADRVGGWWGPVPAPSPDRPRGQTEAEVDVVIADGPRVLAAGEVKWTREPVGFAVLNQLRAKVQHLPGADQHTPLLLFGRAFDPRLESAAASEGVRLVRPADLYR